MFLDYPDRQTIELSLGYDELFKHLIDEAVKWIEQHKKILIYYRCNSVSASVREVICPCLLFISNLAILLSFSSIWTDFS